MVVIESRNLPGLFFQMIITLYHMIPVYRYLEFYISQMYQSAYSFRGHHPPNQKSQNKSNKGCTFQVDTWHVYRGWSQCLRDIFTKLETPQFLQPMLIMITL